MVAFSALREKQHVPYEYNYLFNVLILERVGGGEIYISVCLESKNYVLSHFCTVFWVLIFVCLGFFLQFSYIQLSGFNMLTIVYDPDLFK